jgi:hypothetical protein
LFCGVKTESDRNRKSVCRRILAKTCIETLSHVPSDALSESQGRVLSQSGGGDDDDDVDNESDSNFGPEIARKIRKTVHHLCTVTQKVGVPSNETAMMKVLRKPTPL